MSAAVIWVAHGQWAARRSRRRRSPRASQAAQAKRRVELRYDPEDLSRLDVFLDGKPAGAAVPFVTRRHVHRAWAAPTSGGITQARQRLGSEPARGLFAEVAAPVADEDTQGAFLGPWRLMSRLEEGWLLIAGRNFCNWSDWCAAAGTGAALLWRVRSGLPLPLIQALPDGSCLSVLIDPKTGGKAREKIIDAAAAGQCLEDGKARYVRVIEYEVPDRDSDVSGTVANFRPAPPPAVAGSPARS